MLIFSMLSCFHLKNIHYHLFFRVLLTWFDTFQIRKWLQTKYKMVLINIKNLFESAGLENPRPTEKALEEMGLSRRRFTQLMENVYKSPITVAELEGIKRWITNITEMDPEQVVGQVEQANALAKQLGLSK